MPRTRPIPGALSGVIDVVLILVFAIIGRASHREAVSIGGVLVTWWPFAIGAAFGWLFCYALRIHLDAIGAGLVVLATTVAGGMLLRVLSAQGIAFSFVVVATIVLAVFLVGWRVVVTTVVRRRRKVRPAA